MFLREQHPPQRIAFRVLRCHFVPVIRRVPAPIRSESARRVRLPHRSHPRSNLLPQPLQIGQRQHAFDLHVIHLRQVRPIFQHLRRQVPVICQKHQARRRIIQPPHRVNPFGQSPPPLPAACSARCRRAAPQLPRLSRPLQSGLFLHPPSFPVPSPRARSRAPVRSGSGAPRAAATQSPPAQLSSAISPAFRKVRSADSGSNSLPH